MVTKNVLTKKGIIIFLLLVLAISFFSPSAIAQEGVGGGVYQGSRVPGPTPEELTAINDAVTRFVNGVATQADMDLIDQYNVDIRLPNDVEIKLPNEQTSDPQLPVQTNDNTVNDETVQPIAQPNNNSQTFILPANDQFQFYFNIGVALVLVIVLLMQFYLVSKKP